MCIRDRLCFTFLYFQLKHRDLGFDVLLLGRIQVHKVSGAGGVGPVLLDLLLDGLLLGTQPLLSLIHIYAADALAEMENTVPDAAVLDIMLDGMDGITALKLMRANRCV